MNLENGNKIDKIATENKPENLYMQYIKLNFRAYTKNYINFEDLQKGANIHIEMIHMPDKVRGTSESDFPYSFSKNK